MDKTEKPEIMLHSCCGPCSSSVIERLSADYSITVLFYNPNITDRDEYERRLSAQRKLIDAFNKSEKCTGAVRLIEDEYIPSDFYEAASGLEDEPEGGKRCTECFRLRLRRTAEMAEKYGCDFFTTTLTVSPHKNAHIIGEIGQEEECGQPEYLNMDFKKKDGFKRSIELSKEYDLYRQNYCGCEFSKWY